MLYRILLLLSFPTIIAAQSTAELTVKITGLEPGGQVLIGLYDSADSFLQDGQESTGIVLSVASSAVEYTFNIPAGTYAVSVFHDQNKNDVLDTGLFGIPKEPYGFSKNVFGRLGPPDFADVMLDLAANSSTTTTLQLR